MRQRRKGQQKVSVDLVPCWLRLIRWEQNRRDSKARNEHNLDGLVNRWRVYSRLVIVGIRALMGRHGKSKGPGTAVTCGSIAPTARPMPYVPRSHEYVHVAAV